MIEETVLYKCDLCGSVLSIENDENIVIVENHGYDTTTISVNRKGSMEYEINREHFCSMKCFVTFLSSVFYNDNQEK